MSSRKRPKFQRKKNSDKNFKFSKMSKRKTSSSENPNHDLCELLNELADYEKNVERNIYKHNAYRKAVSVLALHPNKIKSGDEAKKLKGVGDKISKKIDEFLATGKLRKLDNIHNDSRNEAIYLLTKVSGIGPAKASTLVNEGIVSLDNLRKHSDKLTHHQIIGLKYFEDFEKPIPRKEVEEIENIIIKIVKELDPKFVITICGSYRRGKSECGDIDTLITNPTFTSDKVDKTRKNNMLKNIVAALVKCGIITDTLSLGETKFMGACRLDSDHPTRRLDIRFTPHDQYYCSVLYFTGSDMFNKAMRAHALENGFTLNEYTLRPVGSTGIPGEAVDISSEKDIFDVIDYPYKEPRDRN